MISITILLSAVGKYGTVEQIIQLGYMHEIQDTESKTIPEQIDASIGRFALSHTPEMPDLPDQLARELPVGMGTTAETEHGEIATDDSRPYTLTDFESLYTHFQVPLTQYLNHLLGNHEQAEDLAQDVFVKAYRSLSNGAMIAPQAISSWFYRIANNTATDVLRRRRLVAFVPLFDRSGSGTANARHDQDAELSAGEDIVSVTNDIFVHSHGAGQFENEVAEHELVQTILESLPEKQRTVLLLYEYHGFPIREVAKRMYMSPSAAKIHLMRAREHFALNYTHYQKYGVIPQVSLKQLGEQRLTARHEKHAS